MQWTDAIPWIIGFCSLLFAILTFSKNNKKDLQQEEHKLDSLKEAMLKANMKLDQVCATTTETRTDIKSLNQGLSDMDRRVTIMERDLKTAFSAIDELKGRA